MLEYPAVHAVGVPYQRAVADIAKPLTAKQNHKGQWPPGFWTPEMQTAFEQLKQVLTTTPVLKLPDFDQKFEVMADASIEGCGAVLLQETRPCAFFSKQFSQAERKMITSDQELAAIIYALKEWRCYLEGPEFILKTDHEPLTFFESVAQLSRKKTQWLEFLSRFKYTWVHIKGSTNVVADALSRNPMWQKHVATVCAMFHRPKGVSQPIPWYANGTVARTTRSGKDYDPTQDPNYKGNAQLANERAWYHQLTATADQAIEAIGNDESSRDFTPVTIENTGPEDTSEDMPNPLLYQILIGYTMDEKFHHAKYKKALNGIYMSGDKIVVPNYWPVIQYILKRSHDDPLSGHRGFEKTLKCITKDFIWDHMYTDIKHYCDTCDTCQRCKNSTTKSQGLLKPLQLPHRKWGSISMDFIVALPKSSRNNDSVLVVVDRFTKMVRFFPCKTTITSEQLAQVLFQNIISQYGLPDEIISDRGTQFMSELFTDLWKHFGTNQRPSTAYRPQTDGQTERTNRTLQEYLRCYIGSKHTDWESLLPAAEFAHNNSHAQSIGTTPFFLMYGYHPKTPVTLGLVDAKVHPAKKMAKDMEKAVKRAKRMLMASQHRMKSQYDKHHVHKTFAVNDHVLLSTKNLKLQGFHKFLPKYVGPFQVVRAYGTHAFQLALPSGWRIHDVFHVSLLKAYKSRDGVLGQAPLVPSLIDDYVISDIVDHDIIRKGRKIIVYYRVRFKDLPEDADSWEGEKEIEKFAPDILSQYQRDHRLGRYKKSTNSRSVVFDPEVQYF